MELKRFNLIPGIEIFSHSTPIIPRGSLQVKCEKNGGSFGVGDYFGSCLGRFWGSFRVGDHLGWGIISGRVQLSVFLKNNKFIICFFMHALQENFEPTILEIQCDRHRFASRSETNLGFICLFLFYLSV